MRQAYLLLLQLAVVLALLLGTSGTAAEELDPPMVVDGIPRVAGLSTDDFYTQYFYPGRPVILTDAIDHWKALKVWTLDYVKERYGHLSCDIQVNRSSNVNFEKDKAKHTKTVNFGDFVDMVAATKDNPTNDFYMTAFNQVLDQPGFRSLVEDMGPMGDIQKRPIPGAPEGEYEYFTDNPIIAWPLSKGSGKFWLGPKGTLTPLHFDPPHIMHSHVSGYKRWILADARDAWKLCTKAWFANFDPTNPNYKKCPTARGTTFYDSLLGPGETLFIPAGWFHYVEGTDICFSVAFTSFERHSIAGTSRQHPNLWEGGLGSRGHRLAVDDKPFQQRKNPGQTSSTLRPHAGSRDIPKSVIVQNQLSETVRVFWSGKVVMTLTPGESRSLKTFVGHKFTAEGVTSGKAVDLFVKKSTAEFNLDGPAFDAGSGADTADNKGSIWDKARSFFGANTPDAKSDL